MSSQQERAKQSERHLAMLRSLTLSLPEMPQDDEQVLLGIVGYVELLLSYQAVLPPGLATMLRDYLPELADRTGGRWEGAGAHAQCMHLCDQIARDIANGHWGAGDRINTNDDSGRHYYLSLATRASIHRAMLTLAARGEVTIRHDGYYVRASR
jgi:hypothetical protein